MEIQKNFIFRSSKLFYLLNSELKSLNLDYSDGKGGRAGVLTYDTAERTKNGPTAIIYQFG